MTLPATMALRKICSDREVDAVFDTDTDAALLLIFAILALGQKRRNRSEKRPHQTVEFRICDEVRGLLPAQRSAQHARKIEHRQTATRQTARRVVVTEQLTLHAKYRRLQRNKINVGHRHGTLHVGDSLSDQMGKVEGTESRSDE